MCGIAGAVAVQPLGEPDRDRVRQMSDLIEHRGPDGQGIWVSPSGQAVLAHRRLAVIDLDSGAQPMVAHGGSLALTFNGEIYNYIELRDQLRAGGRHFRTASDTEVLMAALDEHGLSAIHAFRGMFAFAAWDDRTRRLTLARDRLGKKPLYFFIEDGVLYFCSSLRALAGTGPRRPSINPEAINAYLALGYVPAPATIYEGVAKLEAGTALLASPNGGLEVTRYWCPDEGGETFVGSFDDAVDQAASLIRESVRLRLRSDVPLGLFLSGGVDSSLIAAIARRDCNVDLQTFTIGFHAAGHDETSMATAVAGYLGTTHRNFRGMPNLLDLVPAATAHFGEPLADSAVLPLWALAKETSRHVTVALSGDGGDEGFGGYHWYRTAERLARVRHLTGGARFASLRGGISSLLHRSFPAGAVAGRVARAIEATAYEDSGAAYAGLRTLFSRRDRAQVLGHASDVQLDRTSAVYRRTGGDALKRMRVADISTYLADCLNPKVDIATMAHAVEARAPLLDHHVLEFGLTLPADYLEDSKGGKRVLRALLRRYLPPEIVNRPKQGFTVPLDDWFAGSLRDAGQRLGASDRLGSIPGIRMEGIRRLISEHAQGTRTHGERLYALLVLDTWLTQR